MMAATMHHNTPRGEREYNCQDGGTQQPCNKGIGYAECSPDVRFHAIGDYGRHRWSP